MGATASVAKSESMTEINQMLKTACDTNAICSQEVSKVSIKGKTMTGCSIVNQNAKCNANCNLKAMADATATLVSKNAAAAGPTIGIGVSAIQSSTKAELSTRIEQACSSAAKAEQIVRDFKIDVDNIDCTKGLPLFNQGMDTSAACMVAVAASAAADVKSSTTASSGVDFGSMGMYVGVGILLLIVLYFFSGSGGGDDGDDGGERHHLRHSRRPFRDSWKDDADDD